MREKHAGYVYEVKYTTIGREVAGGKERLLEHLTPLSRHVFGPWSDVRRAVDALEKKIVERSYQDCASMLAEYSGNVVTYIERIKVQSVTTVAAVDDAFAEPALELSQAAIS